jgi:1-phosphatidylinositol-3-phosphate 5-kinase
MIHSATPNLAFPLPRILLRVRDEDQIRREKALEEIKAERADSAGGVSTSIDGLPRDLAEDERKLEEAIKGRAAGYRLGGDVRVGLGALASAIDGWEGWCRLQRLDVLSWDAVPDALDVPVQGDAEGLGKVHESEEGVEGAAVDGKEALGDIGDNALSTDKALPATPLKTTDVPTYTACTRPTSSIHRYHDRSSDMSMADFMSEMTEELGGTASMRKQSPLHINISRRGSSPTKGRPTADLASSPSSGRTSPTKRENPLRRLSASTASVDASASLNTSQTDLEASTWENVCVRKGCDVAAREHVKVWVQGSRRVVATFAAGKEGLHGLEVGVSRVGSEGPVEGGLSGAAA